MEYSHRVAGSLKFAPFCPSTAKSTRPALYVCAVTTAPPAFVLE